MAELVVDGEQIVPIRGIPFHTGDLVAAEDVPALLSDPEGGIPGTALAGYYRDKLGRCHRVYPYEFTDMERQVAAAPDNTGRACRIAMLMPGVLVFRQNLERVLYSFWEHYISSGHGPLDQGGFEFNPAPRMTAEEETLVYAGFEDLLTDARIEPGVFHTPTDRLNEAARILLKLQHLAAEAGIPFDLNNPPGVMADMVGLLRGQSRAFDAVQDDAVAGYVNKSGCRFKGGRPPKTAASTHALYKLM